jgi:hypothetical protein
MWIFNISICSFLDCEKQTDDSITNIKVKENFILGYLFFFIITFCLISFILYFIAIYQWLLTVLGLPNWGIQSTIVQI